ncbi:MAG: hypothetical protein J1E34_05815 [Oscillospiraceae bacterium]|nr:hypothetical protein [Oscillospiraceae bacterium]
MRDKIVNGFFGSISWAVWAVMIIIVFFSFFLLFTGMNRAPAFVLNSAELVKVDENNENLLQNGKSGENWYALSLDMDISAADLSPFTYTADTFELKAPGDIMAQFESFTVIDEALTFSKASPDSFVLTLYINLPEGEQVLLSRASELGFGIRGLVGHLGFIKNPFAVNLPGFYLSDFPEVSVSFS